MRSAHTLLAFALLLIGAAISAVAQGTLAPNNPASACIQFGQCTTAPASLTLSQHSPITSPGPTPTGAAPTNAVESSSSISELAYSGATAAYTSRIAGSSSGAPNGATSSTPTDATSTATSAAAGSASSTGSGSSGGSGIVVPSISGMADGAMPGKRAGLAALKPAGMAAMGAAIGALLL